MPEPKTHWIQAALARHEADLVRYAAQRLGGDLDRARDVVQEAFLRLCKERREDVGARVAEWLHRVVRNLAIDARRKESRMMTLNDEDHARPDERAPRPGAALEQRDAVAQVLERLDALPEKQREALRLKLQAGLSYKEIAAVMDETVGNVGWLIHVGLKALRGKLAVEGAEL
ncbi:MAG: sigma-70 family RNA polymerase sigma factor [Planctomycetota bacterium]